MSTETSEAKAARLTRVIEMAMGCLDPISSDRDTRLAWWRLLDGLEGREPRNPASKQPEPQPHD